MTTPKAAFRRVAQLPGFGVDIVRVFPIASLTTTTVVVTELKRGEPASRYANWYIVRRDAASSVDRVRQVSAFDGSTGTLTHAGTNYSDTTATSEYVELWAFDPEQLDQFAQRVLNICRRYHRDIIPAHGGDTYYLDQYDWIEHAGHVQRLLHNGAPIVGRNPYFHDRNVVSTGGALEPDEWTKAGSASTWSWSTTNPYRGPRALTVTRAGTDVTVTQNVTGGGPFRSTLSDGVDDVDTETYGVMLVALAGTADAVQPFINDGSGASTGDFHSGGGTYEVMTEEITVSDPSQLSFGFQIVTSDITATIGACVAYKGTISDTIKRDIYEGRGPIHFDWRDRPTAIVPNYRANRGSSYVLESWRTYPLLDNTRLLAGNADADESDIPLDLWAYGIASLLLEAHQVTEPLKYSGLMMEYRDQFHRLRGAHQWDVRPHKLQRRNIGPMLRRV